MYLWLKIFHIVFMVAWYAGMFYIWRLFVYHSETESDEVKKTLAIMEKKLLKIIMNPAMIITITLGSVMLYMQWAAFATSVWIWVKISLVVLLVGLQHMAESYRKKLEKGVKFNSKKFRIINEVPTLILIVIVAMVILKP